MRQIAASEAKTHFLRLLDAVEGGEEVQVSRHGRVIARLVPERARRMQEVREAVAAINELRKHTKPATAEEIVASVHVSEWRARQDSNLRPSA